MNAGRPAARVTRAALLLLAFAFALAAPAPAAVTDTLEIADVARLARKRSPEVLAAEGDLAAARFDSLAVLRRRSRSYSLLAGATVAPRGFYDPAFTNLGDYHAQAGLEWPLRDGGERRRAIARGAVGATAAAGSRAAAARDAVLRAVTLAIERLRLDEIDAGQREASNWLARLAEQMTAAVRSGGRQRAEALRAELERDAADASLAQTERDRETATRELDHWLALPPGSPIPLRAAPGQDERAPGDEDSLRVRAAFARAPEISQAATDEARARLDLDEAQRRNSLQVSLAADAGLAGTDLTAAVPEDFRATHAGATFSDRLRRDLGASAGVQLKLPMLDSGAPHEIAARRAALEAASRRRATAAELADRAAVDLLARWRAAAQRRGVAQASTARAEDHLLRMRSLYAAGATSLLELLDARRVLDDARERLAGARAEVRLAVYESEVR